MSPTNPMWSRVALGIQTKLAVSEPGDRYEREADVVADRVMRMADSAVASTAPTSIQRCGCGGGAQCRCHEDGPERALRATRAVGVPLPAATLAWFEPRFGLDFCGVRVHTGDESSDAAHAVRARAYTVGSDIVFGAGQYAPETPAGRRLIAHELVHVAQQSRATARLLRAPPRIARAPDDESKKTDAPAPRFTPGGHTVAPTGMAACPDAPARNYVVVGCTAQPSPTLRAKETAVLPVPNPAPYGGDPDRAAFAKQLAQCRAEREVAGVIEKRYRVDVAAAEKSATQESKADTEAALTAAVEGIDPKDTRAIARARSKAAVEAKKAAAKKIADAKAAVTRQDVATVTTELAAKYEADLAADYQKTMAGAIARYGASWLNTMQAKLNSERNRITREKSKRPKVAKGETAPPAKSADEIATEVEAEMVDVRCDTTAWALDRFEAIAHGWAVGRREEVDFDTIAQSGKYMKDFEPTYVVPEAARVAIPAAVQEQPGMAGVAPELADFLTQLAANPTTPRFTASNYGGHGGGSWAGKGFSTDLSLKGPLDQRGFWPHRLAVQFLLAIDATAKALGARWRVLYDDFGVAQEVNKATGFRNVVFIGDSNSPRLNWHGPLVLHMHLDLEIPQATLKPAMPAPSGPVSSPP